MFPATDPPGTDPPETDPPGDGRRTTKRSGRRRCVRGKSERARERILPMRECALAEEQDFGRELVRCDPQNRANPYITEPDTIRAAFNTTGSYSAREVLA